MTNFRILFLSLFISAPLYADSLDKLINQRLGYMKSVAIYKWHNTLPIEDIEREKVVLSIAEKQGLELSIAPKTSREFFQLQINAAKEIQYYWFSLWEKNPQSAPENTADLIHIIRPELIKLGNKIVTGLATSNTIVLGSIQAEGLSPSTASKLELSIKKVNTFLLF